MDRRLRGDSSSFVDKYLKVNKYGYKTPPTKFIVVKEERETTAIRRWIRTCAVAAATCGSLRSITASWTISHMTIRVFSSITDEKPATKEGDCSSCCLVIVELTIKIAFFIVFHFFFPKHEI
jgi:hypothetical protein